MVMFYILKEKNFTVYYGSCNVFFLWTEAPLIFIILDIKTIIDGTV